MPSRTLVARFPVDLALTLRPLRCGGGDPTIRLTRSSACRATTTPDGPATTAFTLAGSSIEVEAWGPGAEWALDRAPALLGLADDPDEFAPAHPALRSLHRRLRGLRIGRSDAVVEALLPAILEQKVTSIEARRSYRKLVAAYGEPAPGPLGLTLSPSPRLLASLPYHAFHRFGVERKRAETIRRACSYAHRLEEAAAMPAEAARRRLLALQGIGAWTAARVAGTAFGDADAVVVGDYHLPHLVSWVLAGEPRADDRRMIELLEPYTGHRGRVLHLIVAGGSRPESHHPHLRLRSIASI
ncbi:MAG TPA: DNA-3-methyladenine glycosylase 2 family protein [Actinomycetota bacterium]|nr:DNA-3-methyladenine glycosylase 2 family protein [Actinomycetota bacterium]